MGAFEVKGNWGKEKERDIDGEREIIALLHSLSFYRDSRALASFLFASMMTQERDRFLRVAEQSYTKKSGNKENQRGKR